MEGRVLTGRPKCYFCEERFDWENTRLYHTRTGGSYRRAQASRDVRACYRCIARTEYRGAYQNAHKSVVEDMARRGWTLGEDYYDHGYGWDYFDVLWPDGLQEPPDPSLIPERLRPPRRR